MPENAAAIESDSSSSSDEDETAVQAAPISSTRAHSPPRQRKPPPAKPRKSFAERLAKSQRDESMLPRVTAYCTCEAYKLLATQKFLTEQHAVKGAVIYDEALYARYELPLRNGEGGFRVKSGEAKKDDSSREYSSDSEVQVRHVNGNGEDDNNIVGSSAMLDGQMRDDSLFSPPRESADGAPRTGVHFLEEDQKVQQQQQQPEISPERHLKRRDSTPFDVNALSNLAERNFLSSNLVNIIVFVFSYGVVVFWNFTERQERDILADLTFASNSPPPSRDGQRLRSTSVSPILPPQDTTPLLSDSFSDETSHSPTTHYSTFADHPQIEKSTRPASLMLRVLKEMDVQIEDFHFEYNPRTRSPRIRDDMITFVPLSYTQKLMGF